MNRDSTDAAEATVSSERRTAADRRRRTAYALFYGSMNPRRRKPRRNGELSVASVDWHPPHWLAVGILIVLLSSLDAYLTLTLLEHGAREVNPLMASLIGSSPLAFTSVKIALTAGGVVLLVALARMRAFGRIPVVAILYLVLLGYTVLVAYELQLLKEIPLTL
jgi:hypothetical protein